jgi:hypothetical protein
VVKALHFAILLRVAFEDLFCDVHVGPQSSGLPPQQLSVRYAMSPFIVSKFAT